MFSIFLLINFFFEVTSLHNFFLFYCLNKNLTSFLNNFFISKFFKIKNKFFVKKFILLNKKFRKFSSVKFKNFKNSRKKLRLRLKLKNKNLIRKFRSTPFIHIFFLSKLRAVKDNAIFLTHRKVPNFSNYLIVNNLSTPNISNFYFKRALRLKNPRTLSTLSFDKKNKSGANKLKNRLFVKNLKKNNIYHFLENNEYRFNKEKNFYFFNSLYPRFTNAIGKIKKKKRAKLVFSKFRRIKLISSPIFVKKIKKTTFLFKALFRFFPKKFFKAKQITFGLLRPRTYFFLWSELKVNYFDIWEKSISFSSRVVKFPRKFNFIQKKYVISRLKIRPYSKIFRTLNVPQKLLYYRPVLVTTILFTSKWKAFFLLDNLGFFFSSISGFTNYNFLQNLANFRKDLFSFTMKNELQKKLLKRYFFPNNIEYYGNHFEKLDAFLSKNKKGENSFFFINNFFKFFLTNILKNEKWPTYDIKKNFWNYENIEEMDLTIKRVRFKPGYSIIWREARTVLKSTLNVNFRYQHRLTKYLLKFRKIVNFKLALVGDMSFLSLLLKTKFFPDFTTSLFFFKSGLVFLNYAACTNENLQIFSGDFIQLAITNKYYLVYKNVIGVVLKKKKKLDIISKKKNFVPSNPEEKKRTNNYPKWVLQNKNLLEDIPKFLEVDFYTLSCFVLYEPFLWSDINPTNLPDTKFGIINVYNWKYIN